MHETVAAAHEFEDAFAEAASSASTQELALSTMRSLSRVDRRSDADSAIYLVANTPLKPTREALPVEGGQGRCPHCVHTQSSTRTSHASWRPLGARPGPPDRALSCHNHPPSTLC